VEAATKAFKEVWRKVAAAQRGRYLYKLADLMERDKTELAKLEVLDSGKPFMVARDGDVADSIACFRYFAGWADKIHGNIINSTYDKTCCTVLSPLGVVGAICPWNYTIMMPVSSSYQCRDGYHHTLTHILFFVCLLSRLGSWPLLWLLATLVGANCACPLSFNQSLCLVFLSRPEDL
jgi:hypothetical protein